MIAGWMHVKYRCSGPLMAYWTHTTLDRRRWVDFVCVWGCTWTSDSRLDQVERLEQWKSRPKIVGSVWQHRSNLRNESDNKEELEDILEGLQGIQQDHLRRVEKKFGWGGLVVSWVWQWIWYRLAGEARQFSADLVDLGGLGWSFQQQLLTFGNRKLETRKRCKSGTWSICGRL